MIEVIELVIHGQRQNILSVYNGSGTRQGERAGDSLPSWCSESRAGVIWTCRLQSVIPGCHFIPITNRKARTCQRTREHVRSFELIEDCG